ncbi:MAG: ATP-dependent Clp protease ATP-binding subunit [Oscillospiraceae bacterium]|nr:ATP-dependent Clp protease ATP-binding subunit [Oscillospiraceae bacterium]
MQPTLCSRCGKNPAVVFITRIDAGKTKNEGLCLKCARELHIKPVDDMIQKLGLTDEDLDSFSGNMLNAMNGVEELMSASAEDGDEGDDDGKTATFPFLNRLFGGPAAPQNPPAGNGERAKNGEGKEAPRGGKTKFLGNYCIDLTARAREGKLDRMIGREEELERVIQILNRRQKNNPCLIGDPGVGKTAIA